MPKLPPAVIILQAYYQATEQRLIRIIQQQEARGNVTAYRRRILAQVNAEMRGLDKFAADWLRGEVPAAYGKSAAAVYAYIGESIPVSLVTRSTPAIGTIIENALGEMTDAHNFVGRIMNDELRRAGIEATAMKLSTGDTIKQMQKNMLANLTDRGITAIRDKNGREIRLDTYASMIARTTVREATNLGTLNEMAELGNDLVQMTNHSSACPLCGPLEGRVYSISGNDKRYPPLSAAFGRGFRTIHPNCGHSVTPYIEDFDDDATTTRAFSRRPINQDPRSKAEIESYQRVQSAKAAKRADMKQWNKYRAVTPDGTPKNLATFRRWKQENGPKWQELQGKYR